MDMIYFYSSKYIPPWTIHLFARSFKFLMPSRKAGFEMLLISLVTAHWISSTVWKWQPFKEILTWGRESSRHLQDLASKVGVEASNVPVRQKRLHNCSVLRWRVIVKKEPLIGLGFGRSNSSNSLQQPFQNTHVEFCIYFLPFRDKLSMNYNFCVGKKNNIFFTRDFSNRSFFVLENFAPPTSHSVLWWPDRRRNTMFRHR